MSNSTMFWRLMWKEYRQFRAFAFWLLFIGFIFVLLGVSLGKFDSSYQSTAATMALLFPTLFVAGCAATSFSMEHESKTYLMQRMLPVSVWQVCSAKVIWTLAWAAVIFLVLSVAALLIGGVAQSNFETAAALTYGMLLLEIMGLGTMFSLIDHRPLRALVLSIVAEFALIGFASWISLGVHGGNSATPAIDPAGLIIRVTCLLGLVLLDCWLAKRWFQEGANSNWLKSVAAPVVLRPKLYATTLTLTGSVGMFSHLLWLQARISIWLMLLVGCILLVFGTLFAYKEPGAFLVMPAFVIGCILIGGLTFSAAREQRSFLAQHGARPFWLWLSQIMVPALICSLLAFSLWMWFSSQYSAGRWSVCSMLVLTAFAYGQWGSQISRSSLSAIGAAAILALLAVGWVGLIEFLEVSRWLCVYPFMLIPLVFTLLNTGRWLVGARQSAMARCAAAIPFAAILLSFVVFRMFEISAVDQQELAKLFPMRETRSTAAVKRFREVGDALLAASLNPEETGWNQREETWLPIVLDNKLGLRLSELPDFQPRDQGRQRVIYELVSESFRKTIEEGRIEDGEKILIHAGDILSISDLYYCLKWARIPGNNSERILRVLGHFQRQFKEDNEQLNNSQRISRQILRWVVRGEIDAQHSRDVFIDEPMSFQVKFFFPIGKYLFWERVRQERLLDQQSVVDVKRANYVLACLQNGISVRKCIADMRIESPYRRYQFLFVDTDRYAIGNVIYVQGYYASSAYRREFLIQLALKAWQFDHDGQLPEELGQLAGEYLDQVPNDPFTGQSFFFFPQGVQLAHIDDENGMYLPLLKGESNERTKPFLWSPAWDLLDDQTPLIGPFELETKPSDLTWEQIKRGQIYVIEDIGSRDESHLQ